MYSLTFSKTDNEALWSCPKDSEARKYGLSNYTSNYSNNTSNTN